MPRSVNVVFKAFDFWATSHQEAGFRSILTGSLRWCMARIRHRLENCRLSLDQSVTMRALYRVFRLWLSLCGLLSKQTHSNGLRTSLSWSVM